MKIAKQKSHVKIDGPIKAKAFELVFDRHMVNILSNQLYKDKVLAIVRELSTNALDSQTEAGFDGPFEVHIPSWTDPKFWIRDFGTGMTPEKVDDIYRKYGASDRSGSNDFTGCMGLGSKTPFCYHTKAFTVDSWCDNTHYQYACFLDEDGMPQLVQMSKQASTEPSGVKISLDVSANDTNLFTTAAQRVYKFFNTAPTFIKNKVSIDKYKYDIVDENWKYSKQSDQMKIIMGNVAYGVDEYALGELTQAQRQVVRCGFHVYVDIGEVGVTASREGLDYTNRTKTHIRSYINSIIKTFSARIQEDISKSKNLWEARLKFLEHQKDDLGDIFDATLIVYDGKPLLSKEGTIPFSDERKDGSIYINSFAYSGWRKPKRKSGINYLYAKPGQRFYENDLKVGGYVRSIAEAEAYSETVVLITFAEPKDKQVFCDKMGFDESYLTKISTIPSPTVRSSGVKRGKTTRVVKFHNSGGSYKSYYWKNDDIDSTKGGVYVEFNRFETKLNGVMQHPNRLARNIRQLEAVGITVPDIHGIKTAHLKKFKAAGPWVNFWDWATEQIQSHVNKHGAICADTYKTSLDSLGNYRRLDTSVLHEIAARCDASTNLAQFCKDVAEVEKLSKDWKTSAALRKACEVFDVKYKSEKVTLNLKSLETKLYDTYYLLEVLNPNKSLGPKDLKHIATYINSIDGDKK